MIQIQPESTPEWETPTPQKEILPTNPFILTRIFYTVMLASLLLLMCFYFDLLEDYDLVSMILGFLVCVILQFTLLSYYLAEDMEALQMDEFGVIQDKIKNLFGQLNPVELQRKVRKKYYRRQASEEDKLFSQSNDRIYQNVMTHLRSKEDPNFNELISKVKGKWLSLEHKIKLIEEFLIGMLKIEEGRKLIYQRHKNRIKRIVESEENEDWSQFLANNQSFEEGPTKHESFHTTFHSQEDLSANVIEIKEEHSIDGATSVDEPLAITNWNILNTYMLDKTKLVEKEAADLKERVVQQFQSYASTMRSQSAANAKKRDKLSEDYKISREERNKNLQQLQKTACKIMELSNSLPGNQIEGGEIELILKKQFELRLLKIDSENLLIKLSKTNSLALSNADQLFGYLEEENRNLEHYLDVFKRKINQYMHEMVGYGEKRAPSLKKHLEEAAQRIQRETMRADMDPEVLYTKVMARRTREGSFRGHIDQLVRQFQELKEELSKARTVIRQFKNDFEKKQSMDVIKGAESRVGASTGARVFYFASSVNDQKLTRTFQELVALEENHSQRMKAVLQQQLNIVRQFQKDKGAQFGSDLKHRYQQYKRKEDQFRKAKRRLTKQSKTEKEPSQDAFNAEFDNSKNILVEMILEYDGRCKIGNLLPQIIALMAKHEQDYQKLAAEVDTDEVFALQNQHSIEEERKKQKYAAFSSCLSSEDVIDDRLTSLTESDKMDENNSEESKVRYLIDIWREAQRNEGKHLNRGMKETRAQDFFRYEENKSKSLDMVNKILCILFNEWRSSQLFHDMIKEELLISLNRKKPDIVQHLRIEYFRIIEREKEETPILNLRAPPCEIYRCLFDFHLNFKGKIAVKISSRFKIGNKPELEVKLMIRQFSCPIRVCFTPFSIGKSYASLLDKPKLTIDYKVSVGKFQLTKIPLFTQFIKTYAVIKLRKKFLWPKRFTLSLPLAFKSTLDLAIQQRVNFQKEQERLSKKSK